MTEHRFRPEMSPNDDDFEEIAISNCTQKDLFVTPFFDFELDFDNNEVVEECLNLKEKYPNGVKKSNWGGGWQSQVYELHNIRRTTIPVIQNLARNVIDLTNHMLEQCNAQQRVSDNDIGWWININKGMGYNVHHTHPGCSVIGIYYPKIPKNMQETEGMFSLIRTDAMNHNSAFADIPDNCEYFIRPEEKHLYLMPSTVAHYVTPHFSDEERISIAFNIG